MQESDSKTLFYRTENYSPAKQWAVEVFGKTGCGANTKSSFWVRLVAFFSPQMISNFRPQLNLNF